MSLTTLPSKTLTTIGQALTVGGALRGPHRPAPRMGRAHGHHGAGRRSSCIFFFICHFLVCFSLSLFFFANGPRSATLEAWLAARSATPAIKIEPATSKKRSADKVQADREAKKAKKAEVRAANRCDARLLRARHFYPRRRRPVRRPLIRPVRLAQDARKRAEETEAKAIAKAEKDKAKAEAKAVR